MAATHAPGAGLGPNRGRRGRRTTIAAAGVLAFAAIVVPFGLRDVVQDVASPGLDTPPAAHGTAPAGVPAPVSPGVHPRAGHGVGPRGDLPALLPGARTGLSKGMRVQLGDITDGTLRRAPDGTWEVLVRWNGRNQPVTTRGAVSLTGTSIAQGSASWVSAEGFLYTRVATSHADRFHVYAWRPLGGTAYSPPTLVATDLGQVCFNRSFTAFGDCAKAG